MTGVKWEIKFSSNIHIRFVSCPVDGAFSKVIYFYDGAVWSNGRVWCNDDDDSNWVPLEFGNDMLVREVLGRVLASQEGAE